LRVSPKDKTPDLGEEEVMSKGVKVILGIATLWPLIYVLIFISFWLYMVLSITSQPDGNKKIPPWIIGIFVLHAITMLWCIALIAIYICNVFNNERVEKDKKVLWTLVLFLGNMIAMPIYWYLYIWREASPETIQPSNPGKTEESPRK
jgi:hypothetical protein